MSHRYDHAAFVPRAKETRKTVANSTVSSIFKERFIRIPRFQIFTVYLRLFRRNMVSICSAAAHKFGGNVAVGGCAFGIFVKIDTIDNQQLINSIEKILIQYKGNDDIYVCTEQPRRMFKWNSMKVNLNSPLEIKLQELLGKENVKVKI